MKAAFIYWEILHCVQDDNFGLCGDDSEWGRWDDSFGALVRLRFRACFVKAAQCSFTGSTQHTHQHVYTLNAKLFIVRVYTHHSRNEGVMIDLPFKLSAKIRVKIKEKHRVAPQEVAECFYNRAGITLTDNRENHRTDPPTDS